MTALGEFLRARRAALEPAEVGLETSSRRRVPGLTREEVALRAGVSAAYVTRLEQGLASNVSDQVALALARALRLDGAETDHLLALAGRRGSAPSTSTPRAGPASATTRALLDTVAPAGAYVLTPALDVVAWTRRGHELLAPDLPFDIADDSHRRPNLARLTFSAAGRSRFREWRRRAEETVASLRTNSGRHPEDRELRRLVEDLRSVDDDFATIWADHRAAPCTATRHTYVTATADVTVVEQILQLAAEPDRVVVILTEVEEGPRRAEPDATGQDGVTP